MEYKTAISRRVASAPVRWLAKAGLLKGVMMDYGCGKGKDAAEYGMDSYDTHYQPTMPAGLFDTVLCTYVLNVIEEVATRKEVLKRIKGKLAYGGTAYITVRNDKAALKGTTSKGTWQGLVVLDLPIEYKCSKYITYRMEG